MTATHLVTLMLYSCYHSDSIFFSSIPIYMLLTESATFFYREEASSYF